MDVPVDGPGQDDFFEVTSEPYEIVHALAVGNADDVLFDDGPFIEFFGDEMGGGLGWGHGWTSGG